MTWTHTCIVCKQKNVIGAHFPNSRTEKKERKGHKDA